MQKFTMSKISYLKNEGRLSFDAPALLCQGNRPFQAAKRYVPCSSPQGGFIWINDGV